MQHLSRVVAPGMLLLKLYRWTRHTLVAESAHSLVNRIHSSCKSMPRMAGTKLLCRWDLLVDTCRSCKRGSVEASIRGDVLQEPVAAAMAHGMGKASQEEPAILVVDIGGGTCDISLLQSFEGLLEVVGFDGDSQLGGVDLDEAIVHWLTRSLPVSTFQGSMIQGCTYGNLPETL